MENYLFFAAADINTGGSKAAREGLCIASSRYLSCDPVGTTSTAFFFDGIEGRDEGVIKVVLTHAANKNKDVIKAMMSIINSQPSHGGFVVVADSDVAGASKDSEYSKAFNGLDVTTVAVTESKESNQVTGVSGAGLTGTGIGAPVIKRYEQNGVLVTTALIDLTGLTAHGATNNDVIGIKALAPDAYLFRYKSADHGVLFKASLACLELPAGAGSLVDINVVGNSSGTLGYSEAGGTDYVVNSGTHAAQRSVENLDLSAVTDGMYLYLTEGTTDGDDSVFTAGQLLLTLYGHPVLS